MLNGVNLVNFGNHRDTKLYFGPMTALVGANGSGKTTVMRALKLAQADYPLDKSLVRYGSSKGMISASWPDAENPEKYDVGMSDREWYRRLRISQDEVSKWIPSASDSLEKTNYLLEDAAPGNIVRLDSWGLKHYGDDGIPNWKSRYFKGSASMLQKPSFATGHVPKLNESGSNLAGVLAFLMTADPDRFDRIMTAFREVIPLIRRVRSRPVSIERVEKQTVTINKQERVFEETKEVPGHELVFDTISGKDLPASLISEGTLVTLAILTLVFGDDEVDMIMFDDIELGLHPKAQRDLMRQLKAIQVTHPNLQILVSTHSPYVVDELASEDVWLFTTDDEGCAVAAQLSSHPDAKRALEVLSTGEFWSAEGEEWVAERAKAQAAEVPLENVVREGE